VISVLLHGLILGISAGAVLLILKFILTRVIKIVRGYERGVLFRLGRIQGEPKGPGQYFLIPFVDRMVNIDLSTIGLEMPHQEVMTRDNVPAHVSIWIFSRVVDPIKSVIEIEKHFRPTSQISQSTLESVLGQGDLAQSTLRSVLGQRDFDDLFTNNEAINEELRKVIDEQMEPWGIKVSEVIVGVDIPEEVKGDIARPAESERIPPQGEHPFAETALPQTERPRLEPSPSMLVYLFADRIFQQGGWATWKFRVPCKDDVTVAAKDLAAGLLTVSFLNLREQGIIRLEPFQKKSRWKGPRLALRVVKVNQIEEDKLIGRAPLESLIVNLIDQEDDDVSNLLKSWLVPGVWREAHLYEHVIGIPAREAIVFGYIESSSGEEPSQALKTVEKPVTLGRFNSGPLRLAVELEARCEKIATLEGRFDDFALRMQNLQSNEAELYALLLDECAGAIDNGVTDMDRPFRFRWW
jgi:hypothetical protein